MTSTGSIPSAAAILDALMKDIHSEFSEAEARQYAGVKDGLAYDDFDGFTYNQGVLAGLRVALEEVARQRDSLKAVAAEQVPEPRAWRAQS